jgi:hypothetical protein
LGLGMKSGYVSTSRREKCRFVKLIRDFLLSTDVIGRFYSPSGKSRTSSDPTLTSSKLSKSAQNLKALLADVTKPNAEDGAAAAKAALEKETTKQRSERKLDCTSISR